MDVNVKGLLGSRAVAVLSGKGVSTVADLWRVTDAGELDEMIGEAEADKVRVAFALGKALLTSRPAPVRFKSPKDLAEYMLPKMVHLMQEHVVAVYLRGDGELIKEHLVGIGTADQCLAHPRDVFREGILCGADMMVLVHNHPNCDSDPSDADVKLTERIVIAGDVVGVNLLDHIVIGREGWTSIREDQAKKHEEAQKAQPPGANTFPNGLPIPPGMPKELVKLLGEMLKETTKGGK